MFFEYLFDPIHNSIFKPTEFPVNYYEDHLPNYWIDSSHNTYLTGNQYSSDSSTEQYRLALLRGCRCIELDVWDGPNGIPIVLHGYTLTKPVPFADCIESIHQNAFEVTVR